MCVAQRRALTEERQPRCRSYEVVWRRRRSKPNGLAPTKSTYKRRVTSTKEERPHRADHLRGPETQPDAQASQAPRAQLRSVAAQHQKWAGATIEPCATTRLTGQHSPTLPQA